MLALAGRNFAVRCCVLHVISLLGEKSVRPQRSSWCLKEFPGCVGSMDYSGFDRENWNLRNRNKHNELSLKLLAANTKTELQRQESKNGCRYSVLTGLPYFDAPRMLIVDPMHNLFLGSAKHLSF